MPTYTQNKPTSGFATLPEGFYRVTVENAELGLSKSKNEMITLTLSVDGFPAKLFERLVFTEAAFWKIDQTRAGLGFEIEEGEDAEIEADDFVGKSGWVHVNHREYKNEPQAQINYWVIDEDEIAKCEDEADENQSEAVASGAEAESGDDGDEF